MKALEPYSGVDVAVAVRAENGFKGAWWSAGDPVVKGAEITPENERRISLIYSDLDKLKTLILRYLEG